MSKNNKQLLKNIFIVLFIIVLCVIITIGFMKWNIRQTVKQNCQLAQKAHPHPGDDIAALIEYMNSTEHSLYKRSHKAVWTLGQLRDAKALEALESKYTGESCDHNNGLCQYEIAKAIKLCGGELSQSIKTHH